MYPGSAVGSQDLATVLRQVLKKNPKNEAKEGFECFFFDSETMNEIEKCNELGATHLEALEKHKHERPTPDQLPKNGVPKQAKPPIYILYADRSPEAARSTLGTVARISKDYWPRCFGFRDQASGKLEKDEPVICAFIGWLREGGEIEHAVPTSQNVRPISCGRFDVTVIFERLDTAR
ncbi:hypothetical protein CCHR01_17629 [Colletotrichum chrysophilum]|uniref:Uncharacterized protein n=1 Tax=Colletotrichum chrysophilum TaxID=1836956 RepID=A0AAD9E8X3_9PEZI|nr:hypothetical protein CCHR01_17629 [Colletotrichum chrysophilum]